MHPKYKLVYHDDLVYGEPWHGILLCRPNIEPIQKHTQFQFCISPQILFYYFVLFDKNLTYSSPATVRLPQFVVPSYIVAISPFSSLLQ